MNDMQRQKTAYQSGGKNLNNTQLNQLKFCIDSKEAKGVRGLVRIFKDDTRMSGEFVRKCWVSNILPNGKTAKVFVGDNYANTKDDECRVDDIVMQLEKTI